MFTAVVRRADTEYLLMFCGHTILNMNHSSTALLLQIRFATHTSHRSFKCIHFDSEYKSAIAVKNSDTATFIGFFIPSVHFTCSAILFTHSMSLLFAVSHIQFVSQKNIEFLTQQNNS